ncbi:MAG: APC family permease [Planctomycetota bacterium]
MTSNRPELKRAINRFGFFALAFGSMIGVGWITGLKDLFGQAGPVGTSVAFLIGGTLMVLIGLCYAEAIQRAPVTGGEVAYSYLAFGTGHAFAIGWCLALGYFAVSAFEAVSIGIVVSYLINVDYWPLYEFNGSTVFGSHVAIAVVFTLIIASINHFGVALATRAQTVLTFLIVILAAAFVIAGISRGSVTNLTPAFGSTEMTTALGGLLAVFVTVPFFYVGFDTIPQAAEERTEDCSTRSLGKMLILSIVGASLFYAAVFLSVGMATPWQSITDQPLPTAAAFRQAFDSGFWERVVLLVGLLGLLTSWNGFFLSGCRVLFSLGRGRIIHPSFGNSHARFGTPTAAIVFGTILTIAGATLGKKSVLVFVNVGSLCIALAFLGVACSLAKIRRMDGTQVTGLRRWLPMIAGAGALFIVAAMLVPSSPAVLSWPVEWIVLAVVPLTGIAFWFLASKIRLSTDENTRRELMLGD